MPNIEHISEKKEDRLREYRDAWKRDSLTLNGTKIEMYGVAHYPETLEIPEFKRELEEGIESSPIVLYEIIPSQNKHSARELAEARIQVQPSMKGAKSLFEYHYSQLLNANPSFQFYEELQKYSAQKAKPIAVADPLENAYKSILLEKCDLSAQEAKHWAMIFSAILASGAGIQGLAGKTIAGMDWNKKISRRGFTKILAGAAAGAALGSFLSIEASERNKPSEQFGRAENPLGAALYEIMDFRDAATAEGLERLSKKYQGERHIGMVYGSKHLPGIKHYALNPVERKAKLLAYLPYRQVSAVETKIYEYDQEWKLAEKL